MIFSLDDILENIKDDKNKYSDEEIKTKSYIAAHVPDYIQYKPPRYQLMDSYDRILPDIINNFPLQQVRRMPFSSGLLGMWWGTNEIQIANHLYGEAQWEVEIHERQHQINPYNPEQENRNIVKSILPFKPVFH